jgi:hypothetical protein
MATKLKVIDYPIAKLLEMRDPSNPRWMPEEEREALRASLDRFGFVEPVIVNLQTNLVVGGHQRIDVAEEMGIFKTLPVVEINVEPVKGRALNLSLNKLKGDWDYEKLAAILAEVNEADVLSVTGFSTTEAESIIGGFLISDVEIAGNTAEEGVVRDIRNRTDEEVETQFSATEKVQFGMFSRAFLAADYERWVQSLASENGESPAALGAVVAKLLGIELVSESGGLAQFDGSEGEEDKPIED